MGLREQQSCGRKAETSDEALASGDIVLVYDANQSRTLWKMGRVEELLKGSDGKGRGVSLCVRSGSKTTLMRCPIQHLYPLEVCASNGLPTQTAENSGDRDEDNTEWFYPLTLKCLKIGEPGPTHHELLHRLLTTD